jgi:hypothetical protein
MSATAKPFVQSFFHGTRADLSIGDVIRVGHTRTSSKTGALSWVYFAATMDAAIWGAELSRGDGPERIYVVEPTGPIEDDPNVTDKRFPRQPDAVLPIARPTSDHCGGDAVARAHGRADPADEARS